MGAIGKMSAQRTEAGRLRRWLPLALVAIGFAAVFGLGLGDYLSVSAISRYRDTLAGFVSERPVGAAVLYCLAYVLVVAVSIPGASILTVAGGLMFGTLAGTILAAASATAGATLIFLAARTSLGAALSERAGPRIVKLRAGFQVDSFNYLLFLRLAPVFPFWLVNLAAALFGMATAPYVAATAIGILPATAVFAYLGSRLGTAIRGEDIVVSPGLVAAFGLLALLALLPPLLRRLRAARDG